MEGKTDGRKPIGFGWDGKKKLVIRAEGRHTFVEQKEDTLLYSETEKGKLVIRTEGRHTFGFADGKRKPCKTNKRKTHFWIWTKFGTRQGETLEDESAKEVSKSAALRARSGDADTPLTDARLQTHQNRAKQSFRVHARHTAQEKTNQVLCERQDIRSKTERTVVV
jgi:hypothetical protein